MLPFTIHTLTFAMKFLVHSYTPFGRLFNYFLTPQIKNMSSKIHGKNINSRHLKKGDPLPHYNGILRLYNMRFCPYAQRAALVLNAKNIHYEVVNCDLMQKPDWLFEKSPFGKVPSIEIEESVVVYESLIISDYLDELKPERPLLPSDPLQRAFDRLFIEKINPIAAAFIKYLKFPEKFNDDTIKACFNSIDAIQAELNKRDTMFLHGNEAGYVDLMIWPWLERLCPINMVSNGIFDLPKSKYSKLLSYIEDMKHVPAVEEYLINEENHVKFMISVKEGSPAYDILL